LAALPQNTICPAPKPTEAASATSSFVKAEPFQVAPTIVLKLVPISNPIHFPEPCDGLVEAKLLRDVKLPLIVTLLPS
jgi:hypothetical protein